MSPYAHIYALAWLLCHIYIYIICIRILYQLSKKPTGFVGEDCYQGLVVCYNTYLPGKAVMMKLS